MRKIIEITLIACVFLLISCNEQTERVTISTKVSVELPVNYKMTNDFIKNKGTTFTANYFTANYNNDKIAIFKLIVKELDTLNIKDKKEWIKPNLLGFIKPFNGKNLINTEKMIGEIVQSDFSYDLDEEESSFIVYGRVILQDMNFILLSYMIKKPVSSSSINGKEIFLKSIKYKI